MRHLLPLSAFLFVACPAHEGPIDVVLLGMDDTAEITWSDDGATFQPCENATTNPEAVVGCGPYGVGEPGDYIVRVVWTGVAREKEVTLEKDRSYQANVELTFDAGEFANVD